MEWARELFAWPNGYVCAWCCLCVAALALALARRHALAERYRGYIRFLFVPWKLITFLIALAGITLIAPYTGDPYWDHTVPASSLLYFMAGLFWSLDHRNGKTELSFTCADWPRASARGAFVRLLPWCAPMMALVSYLIVGFVYGWL
jgi:hypothetical protein